MLTTLSLWEHLMYENHVIDQRIRARVKSEAQISRGEGVKHCCSCAADELAWIAGVSVRAPSRASHYDAKAPKKRQQLYTRAEASTISSLVIAD